MPGVDMRVPEKRIMRTVGTWSVAVTLCGIAAWSVTRLPGLAVQAAHPDAQGNGAAMLTDWLTDGGDNQRTGWNKTRKDPDERQRQGSEAALEDRDRQRAARVARADASVSRGTARHGRRPEAGRVRQRHL